jgi:hypothetical protein
MTCFVATAFQLCFTICHQEGPRKQEGLELNVSHDFLVYAEDDNKLAENINTV